MVSDYSPLNGVLVDLIVLVNASNVLIKDTYLMISLFQS